MPERTTAWSSTIRTRIGSATADVIAAAEGQSMPAVDVIDVRTAAPAPPRFWLDGRQRLRSSDEAKLRRGLEQGQGHGSAARPARRPFRPQRSRRIALDPVLGPRRRVDRARRGERLRGLPVLALELRAGTPVRVASLEGAAVLHELADASSGGPAVAGRLRSKSRRRNASRAVPSPGVDSTSSVPPSRASRSRIPTRPRASVRTSSGRSHGRRPR